MLTVPKTLCDVEAPLLTFNELAVIVPFLVLCAVEVDDPVEVVDEIYFPLTHPLFPLKFIWCHPF